MVIIGFYGNDMAIFVCLRTFQTGLCRDDIVERIADDEDRLITEAISMLAGIISFELRKPLRCELQPLMQDIAVRGSGFFHLLPCGLPAHIVDHGIAAACGGDKRQCAVIIAAALLVCHGHRDATAHAARVESNVLRVNGVVTAHIADAAQQVCLHGGKRIGMRLRAVLCRACVRVKIHAHTCDAAACQTRGKLSCAAAVAIAGKSMTDGDQWHAARISLGINSLR